MHQRRKATIEKMAATILKEHKCMSPGFSLSNLVKRLKIELESKELESNISGYSAFRDGKKAIVVNNGHPKARRRFTIAHELGHLLLHDFNEFNFNDNEKVYFRNDISASGMDEYEVEANYFAACLLMPKNLVKKEFEQLGDSISISEDQLNSFSEKFGVSTTAMTIRLVKLGLIEP